MIPSLPLTPLKAGSDRMSYRTPMSESPLLPKSEAQVVDLPMEARFVDSGIASRTLLSTGNLRVVLFAFDSGQELTEHTTPHRGLVQVLSGTCEFKLGDTWHHLSAGQMAHMPPGLPHAVRAVERFSMLLTLVKAEPAAAEAPAPQRSPTSLIEIKAARPGRL